MAQSVSDKGSVVSELPGLTYVKLHESEGMQYPDYREEQGQNEKSAICLYTELKNYREFSTM